MTEGRECCIYLPNEKILELFLQTKLLGRDLFEIVSSHFGLKENGFFGICYRNESGFLDWLQNDKRVLEHDIAKKISVIEFYLAIKFYVDDIISIKHCLTIELYYLLVKSGIYKGEIEVDCNTAFKLASYVLQITFGDFHDENTALERLRKLPVLPDKVLKDFPTKHCETSILSMYKETRGTSKGKAILSYLTCVELLPCYGIHYYKVKDKSGIPWWLGIGSKGIFQFDFHNKASPIKTFYWRQLENLYFREKRFLIELNDQYQQLNDHNSSFGFGSVKKLNSDTKSFAWYGSPTLIKSIWLMSKLQHQFYLDARLNKSKFKDSTSSSLLAEKLTNFKDSIISPFNDTAVMTQAQIKNVNVTVKKGCKEESPEVRAAKRDMSEALKVRRTELEDRLYEKVQELKKTCLQEAEIIGKLPQEYVRYMDLNEKPPKIKKRIGAEYKLKLKSKDGTVDRDYSSSVTAASSSSSGFGSEATEPSDELSQLEQELEILTQIAQAAKKIASDPSAKGRIRAKRMKTYKKNLEKLQEVENKINTLREKIGQEPSSRVSRFFDEEIIIEDGTLSVGEKSESEKSSFSDGILLEDDTSLSSVGDVLSTHSTPIVLDDSTHHSNSEMLSRKIVGPSDVDIEDLHKKRALTPPPSFCYQKTDHPSLRAEDDRGMSYPLLPSPSHTPNHTTTPSAMSNSSAQTNSTRNWISQKWAVPHRSKQSLGWNESALDSNRDSASISSKQSDDSRSINSNSPSRQKMDASLSADQFKVTARPMKAHYRPSANTNHNNHKQYTSFKKQNDAFNLSSLKREISDSSLSDISTKSNPSSSSIKYVIRDGRSVGQSKEVGLAKISEHSSTESLGKRRSSACDSSTQSSSHSNAISSEAIVYSKYEVRRSSLGDVIDDVNPKKMSKSKSAQSLQSPKFETKKNIQMQYSNRRNIEPNGILTSSHYATTSRFPSRHSQQEMVPHSQIDENSTATFGTVRPTAGYVQTSNVGSSYYHINPAYPFCRVGSFPHGQAYNSIAYSDISLEFLPSLSEYGSRSSVSEGASVHNRKEDIRRMLKDHIASRKSSVPQEICYERTALSPNSYIKVDEQHANYVTSTGSSHPPNIFQHKQPPSALPNRYVLVQNQPHSVRYHQPHRQPHQQLNPGFRLRDTNQTNQHAQTDANVKRQLFFQHYRHHERGNRSFDSHGVHPDHMPYDALHGNQPHQKSKSEHYYTLSLVPSESKVSSAHYRWVSEPNDSQHSKFQGNSELTSSSSDTKFNSRSLSIDKGLNMEAVVVQSVCKQSDGREVSVFKVTKSAPNTPLMKRHKQPLTQVNLSSDSDDSDVEVSSKTTNQPAEAQLQTALDKTLKETAKRQSPIVVYPESLKDRTRADAYKNFSQNTQSKLKEWSGLSSKRLYSKSGGQTKKQSYLQSPMVSHPHKMILLKHNATEEDGIKNCQIQRHLSTPSSQSFVATSNNLASESVHSGTLPRRFKSSPIIAGAHASLSSSDIDLNKSVDRKYVRSQSATWQPLNHSKKFVQSKSLQEHEPYEQVPLNRYHIKPDLWNRKGTASFNRQGLSASAENLLWSESGNNQAGTLV